MTDPMKPNPDESPEFQEPDQQQPEEWTWQRPDDGSPVLGAEDSGASKMAESADAVEGERESSSDAPPPLDEGQTEIPPEAPTWEQPVIGAAQAPGSPEQWQNQPEYQGGEAPPPPPSPYGQYPGYPPQGGYAPPPYYGPPPGNYPPPVDPGVYQNPYAGAYQPPPGQYYQQGGYPPPASPYGRDSRVMTAMIIAFASFIVGFCCFPPIGLVGGIASTAMAISARQRAKQYNYRDDMATMVMILGIIISLVMIGLTILQIIIWVFFPDLNQQILDNLGMSGLLP